MKREMIIGLILFAIVMVSGCTDTEYLKTSVPCQGANYGGDIAQYEQESICSSLCSKYGGTKNHVYNTHCYAYLSCSCYDDN